MEKKRALSLDLASGFMLLLIIFAHVPLMLYLNDPGVVSKLHPENMLEKVLNGLMVLFGLLSRMWTHRIGTLLTFCYF